MNIEELDIGNEILMTNSPPEILEVHRIRYERLSLVVEKALEQTIDKSFSLDQITKCYPTIANTQYGLKHLESARSQMIDYLNDTCTKEIKLIFNEHDIEKKLNELDEIIQLAQYRKQLNQETPIEIDRLSASEIIESNIIQSKKEVINNLGIIYNQLCIENKDFFEELKQKTNESESIKTEINSSIESLNDGIDSLKNNELNSKLDSLISQVLNDNDG